MSFLLLVVFIPSLVKADVIAPPTIEEPTSKNKEAKSESNALYYVIGGVSICIVGVLTIVLVNKNSKKEEVK